MRRELLELLDRETARIRVLFVAPFTVTSSMGLRCVGTSPRHIAKSQRTLSKPRIWALLLGVASREPSHSSTGRACMSVSYTLTPLRQDVIPKPHFVGSSCVTALRHLFFPVMGHQSFHGKHEAIFTPLLKSRSECSDGPPSGRLGRIFLFGSD